MQRLTHILLIAFYGLALLRSIKGIAQLYQTYSVSMYYQYTVEYFLSISYLSLLIRLDSTALQPTDRIAPTSVLLLILNGILVCQTLETCEFLIKTESIDPDNSSALNLNTSGTNIRLFSATLIITAVALDLLPPVPRHMPLAVYVRYCKDALSITHLIVIISLYVLKEIIWQIGAVISISLEIS